MLDRARDLGLSDDAILGGAIALGLVLVAFIASGGTNVGANTWVEVALVVIGAALAAAVLVFGAGGPAWGARALLAFVALAALTYASIAWSVQPESSWLEANRTLSYLAAFGGAVALARLAPARWRAVVGAIAAASVVICGYSLLAKAFPATFDPGDTIGRLRLPFDYWNAVGLTAAMGIPACLWGGARREHAPVTRSLSVPGLALLIGTLMLSYSRGTLVVAIVVTACWFALVPLRLRAALILALGIVGGAAITAWAFSTHGISANNVAESARVSAGHGFAVLLAVVVVLATLAGCAAALALDRVELTGPARRRLGAVLVGVVALVPVAGLAALAQSSRGFTGEVSHIVDTLTSTTASVGGGPGRLVNLSNTRPVYWREGFLVGEHNLLAGTGAVGFATASERYTNYGNTIHAHVTHAHSYLVETFADFGLIGLALTLVLLVAWWIAVKRSLGLRWRGLRPAARRGPRGEGPPGDDQPADAPPAAGRPGDGRSGVAALAAERVGSLTLLAIVLAFGLHSLIDWTWFIPGNAVAAMVCAGWLAGRGPLSSPVGRAERRRRLSRSPGAGLLVASLIVAAVGASWVIVQPLRADDALAAAEAAVARGQGTTALDDARTATARDPLSVDPLFLLWGIYTALGQRTAARDELVQAVQLQSANPETWQWLGCFDLYGQTSCPVIPEAPIPGSNPGAALRELERAYLLDPDLTTLPAAIQEARDAAPQTT